MAEPTDKVQATAEAARELRERQDKILGLDDENFRAWCWDVATLRVDSVIGLVWRLSTQTRDTRRLVELKQVEEAAVDQLDREELLERWEQRRLTGYQCHYWWIRRPREVPTVDGYPVWTAVSLVDVAG